MATKATPKKAAPKSQAARSKKTAPAKQGGDDGMVVFAFRLTRAERDLIHATAGSAKASRFVKGAALAAAARDRDAFKALIAETPVTK